MTGLEKAIENGKALRAANEPKRRRHYHFHPTAVFYALVLVVLVVICAVMCVKIDRVCREVVEIKEEQAAQAEHMDAIDCWLINIEQEIEAQPKLESLGEFELTWYCSEACCCGQYANGYTSTGAKAVPGRTIAVDPKVIPYGTKVIINGHEYVAEDCGGAIKGNRIDILAESHSAALDFGRQKAEVFIVKETLVAEGR